MRTVIVTGGTKGIGLAIVRALAADGYRAIAIARRRSSELAEAEEAAAPGAIHFHACDLAKTEALAAHVKALREAFGAPYGLVNNAGIGTSGVLATMADRDIEHLVQVNVTAQLILTKYVVRAMMAGGSHRIVNIGSIVASTGYTGLAPYAATKSALGGFTRALARELGPLGITVNMVAPGFVDTDMTAELNPAQLAQIARRSALGRLASTVDVAAAVLFFLSDAAHSITGTTLTVDGGNTAYRISGK
jgi:3-oxoacyl-[acyl-carrier protein] reductase